MNIFKLNIRGLGKPSKRRLLRDLLKEDPIDIVTMKDTLKAKLTDRIIKSLSPN